MQENILHFFQTLATPALDFVFEAITFLGEEYVAIAIISWVYWNFSKKEGIILALVFMISTFINQFTKILFHTQRPFMVLENIEGKRQATATGYSFPSGHAQGASTLYYSLFLIFKRQWILICAIILAFLVAISRVYLGVHWPIDVTFGLIFGFLIPFLFYSVLHKNYENAEHFQSLLIKILLSAYFLSTLLFLYNFFIYQNELEFNDAYKVLGVFTGTILGYFFQEKQVRFAVEQKTKAKIIRYALGIATTIGLLIGLKILFAAPLIFLYLRYLIVGAWITGFYPMLGVKLRLFEKCKCEKKF